MDENRQDGEEPNNQSAIMEASDQHAANEATVTMDDLKLDGHRLKLLSWMFLERFLEMLIVLPLTLVAIYWTSARSWLEGNFWPAEIFAIILLFIWKALMYRPSLTRFPGCLLPKFIYLVILVVVHIILGIHFPRLFYAPKWSAHFAVLAAGTAGITYVLLSVLSINKKVNIKNKSYYYYATSVLVAVLLISQLVYLAAFTDGSYGYGWFMLTVCSALLITVNFTFSYIYISKRCAHSKRLEDIVARDGAISFSESLSLSTLVFHHPFNKEEKKRRKALQKA